MQSYRTWFWSCHCWHKTHVLFGDSCCIHLYSRCIHLYRRWFMVCLFGIIFFDMPTIWAFTLTFLDTALPSLKHQKPKSSCLILLHILSSSHFFTLFFICFHNNNQLTFYFLSYYLTKDSIVQGLRSEEKGLYGLYTHKYFILCHNFVMTSGFYYFKKQTQKGTQTEVLMSDTWVKSTCRRAAAYAVTIVWPQKQGAKQPPVYQAVAKQPQKRPASQHSSGLLE